MTTCIHCGHEVTGWIETAQGMVCHPCNHHKLLHEAIREHRGLHREKAKPELIPLEEPEDLKPVAPTTTPREYTLDGVVFEETGESRRATQHDWFLGIDLWREPCVCHGTVTLGPVPILRPVRVEGQHE